MQEFTVVCTTCQSRIKVRNPNLIGQIVPCPKCSSMVLIENNNRVVVSPTGTSANSQTETKVGLGPLSDPATAADDNLSVQGRRRFKSESPASELEKVTVANEAKSISKAPASNSLDPSSIDESSGSIDLNRVDWSTTRSRGRRQILLVFFLSLSSCIIAAILFILFIRSWGPASEIAQNGDMQASPVAPTLPAETDNSSSTPSEEEKDTSDSSQASIVANPDSTPQQTSVVAEESGSEVPPPAPPAENDSTNSAEPTPKDMATATPPVEPEMPENVSNEPPTSEPSPATTPSENKVDFPPSNIADSMPATETGSNASTQVNAPQLPDSLLKLATVFDPSLETRLGETPGSQIKPGNSPPDIAALPVTTNTKLHPPAAEPIDYAKKISEEIAGIDIKDRPLADVLEIWSQLSSVGIDVQWSELAAANVRPQDLVSYRSGRTSYGDMLKGIVEPLGLQLVESDTSFIRLTPSELRINEILPKDWSVKDLITELCPEEKLSSLLLDLVPTSKGSWSISNGEIKWAEGERQTFQKFAILQVVEHLRIVRGLQQKSNFHPELFNRPWPSPQSESAMKNTLTQPSIKNAPTSQVLANAAREVDSLLSVDWPGTWTHGLSPTTEDTLLPKGRNLETLAQVVATKYGLEVAWLSSNHLLLTTAERLNRMEILVHLSIEDNLDTETLRRRLARVSTLNDQGLPSIRFARDPESGMFLAYIRPPLTTEVLLKP